MLMLLASVSGLGETSPVPQNVLYFAIGVMGTVIAYLGKLYISSVERQHTEDLKHHDAFVEDVKAERLAATEKSDAHTASLEGLITTITSERNTQIREMTTALTLNIKAMEDNTKVREAGLNDIKIMVTNMPDTVTKAVLNSLIELGFLVTPHRAETKFQQPKGQ